jgi:hypothetical protein
VAVCTGAGMIQVAADGDVVGEAALYASKSSDSRMMHSRRH